MAYFEWADDLVIDHGMIDADHRHLIDLVNQLHTATTAGDGQTVVEEIITQLVAYTQRHFAREESLMEQAGMPGVDAHKAGHRHLIGTLVELQRKHAAGSITTAAQVSSMQRDWLSLHIRRSDRELRDVLKVRRPVARSQ